MSQLAAILIVSADICQPNAFQLLQDKGGVKANPLLPAKTEIKRIYARQINNNRILVVY